MHFLFLPKVPVNKHPPMFPSMAPMERAALTGPFLHISQITQKNFPKQKTFSFCQKSQERSVFSCSPKARPLWKETPVSGALLGKYFGVPCKGAIPLRSLHRAPQREMFHSQSPFSFILRSPQYTSPLLGFPFNRITNINFTGKDFFIFPDTLLPVYLTHIHYQFQLSIMRSSHFWQVMQL